MKFLKCQKVREIQIELAKMPKSTGKSNSQNVTNCGKFKFPKHQKMREIRITKCQKVRENSNPVTSGPYHHPLIPIKKIPFLARKFKFFSVTNV